MTQASRGDAMETLDVLLEQMDAGGSPPIEEVVGVVGMAIAEQLARLAQELAKWREKGGVYDQMDSQE